MLKRALDWFSTGETSGEGLLIFADSERARNLKQKGDTRARFQKEGEEIDIETPVLVENGESRKSAAVLAGASSKSKTVPGNKSAMLRSSIGGRNTKNVRAEYAHSTNTAKMCGYMCERLTRAKIVNSSAAALSGKTDYASVHRSGFFNATRPPKLRVVEYNMIRSAGVHQDAPLEIADEQPDAGGAAASSSAAVASSKGAAASKVDGSGDAQNAASKKLKLAEDDDSFFSDVEEQEDQGHGGADDGPIFVTELIDSGSTTNLPPICGWEDAEDFEVWSDIFN